MNDTRIDYDVVRYALELIVNNPYALGASFTVTMSQKMLVDHSQYVKRGNVRSGLRDTR